MPRRHELVSLIHVFALVLGSVLVGAAASAQTFHPGTSPEYSASVRQYFETLKSPNLRFTQGRFLYAVTDPPGGFPGDGVVTNSPREGDPTIRTTLVAWSVLSEGIVIESTPGTLFHPDASFRLGQFRRPDASPENGGYPAGIADNFTNSIRARLSGLPPPFGFLGDGGEERWLGIVRSAFLRWETVASLNLQEVNDGGQGWDRSGFFTGVPSVRNGGQGDIRIAMTWIDGPSQPDGSSGGLLAFTYGPTIEDVPPIDQTDDNDTPDDVEDDVINIGYCGNIVLDAEDKWNDPSTPNILLITLVREIGRGLGLLPACPNNPTEPYSVMQNQVFGPPTGGPRPGQPFPQLFFDSPQEDDIRAIHALYGDRLDENDTFSTAQFVSYSPNPQTNVFEFSPHLARPSTFFSSPTLSPDGVARPIQLSLGSISPDSPAPPGSPDVDIFRFVLPDTVTTAAISVRLDPIGTPFTDGVYDPALGDCTAASTARTPIASRDLQFNVSAFDPFTNTFTELIAVNDGVEGEPESAEVPVSAGTYFVRVSANLPAPLPNPLPPVQLYNMTVTITTPFEDTGVQFSRLTDLANVEAIKDLGYFGAAATIGVVDGAHIADQHIVFAGRQLDRVNWPGVLPATTTAGAHATAAAGVAAGSPFLLFEGVAPEAGLASATVSTEVFPDGTFSVGKTALYYALFGLADTNISRSAGLAQRVSVVLSTWGAGGRRLDGEDTITQAYDVAASMTGVTFVVAAGNNGQAEGRSFANCPLNITVDTESPGAQYQGSRSISTPATAVNVISVGSSGEVDPNSVPVALVNADDIDQVVAGFSAKGPIDANDLDVEGGDATLNVRSGIDILAPGTGIATIPVDFAQGQAGAPDPCTYRGATASSFVFVPTINPGDDADAPADPEAFALTQGTSISASIVAGTVALLQDLAQDQTPVLSVHPSVIKAVLLNGARKMRGWTNSAQGPGKPQDQRDGFELTTAAANVNVVNTTNPLDRAQGAGVLDVERTLENYLTGYPPAAPPQSNFDGPTRDLSETDPLIPTIRRPLEPGSTSTFAVLDELAADPAQDDELPMSPIDAAYEWRRITAPEPDFVFGETFQRGFVDQKGGRGASGAPGATVAGPRVPFIPPSFNGGNNPNPGGNPGPPQGPPGAVNPGVRPREIVPLFVDPIGWDIANIDQRNITPLAGGTATPDGFIDYVIRIPLLGPRPDPSDPAGPNLAADRLTVTLSWQRELRIATLNFSNPNDPRIGILDTAEFENLNLFLFACDSEGNPTGAAIRSSVSQFSPTEHIFTDIPQAGLYLMRVRWAGTVYDAQNRRPLAEQVYAIAWRVDFSPRSSSLAATDMTDLVGALRAFGSSPAEESGYDMSVDRDLNGKIDFRDLTQIILNWDPARRAR